MKKAIVFAIASCLLMASAAFAFETKTVSDTNGSYIEQMAKKKKSTKKTSKKSSTSTTAPAN